MFEITLRDASDAVKVCVASARGQIVDPKILAAAEKGLEIISFIAANPDLYKEVRRIERELPEVAELIRDLPGLRIVSVR